MYLLEYLKEKFMIVYWFSSEVSEKFLSEIPFTQTANCANNLNKWNGLPFRYVRMLGALYMRLTGTAIDCYKYLEPLYNDYRKIKSQNRNGGKQPYAVTIS